MRQFRRFGTAKIIPGGFEWTIKTSQLRDRQITKAMLPNGLSAVVISDPLSPTAGAALSIEAGSWLDGKYAGTAHFTEHMLFLGSSKYPKENDYERFIYDSNGSLNGYTSNDHSMYHFTGLAPYALDGALDRFSRFFYEPLFNPSCVNREMNAVDEEFRRNIQTDGWRALHVRKELANQDHPFNMFNTGNLDTMKLIDQSYLRQWFNTHYKADGMHLVVQGPDSTDVLLEKAQKYFLPIERGNLSRNTRLNKPLYPQSLQGQVVWIEPIKNVRELTLTWELDYEFVDLAKRTADLAAHAIAHEGFQSLLSELRREGLAEGLSAAENRVGYDNYTFDVSVTLTEKGLTTWQNVIERVHRGIERLRNSEYPEYIFEEVNAMNKVSYEYQQRSPSSCISFCSALRLEGIESFPNLSYRIKKFDSLRIKQFLSFLRPEKAISIIIAKDSSKSFDSKEKWMGAAYSVFPHQAYPLPINSSSIDYPKKNAFIPDDLLLVPSLESSQKHPQTIEKNVFHYFDTEFLVPQAAVFVEVKIPSVRPDDARSICLLSILLRFVHERLTELSYDASFAGVHYDVWKLKDNGIGISVEGYTQKLKELLSAVLQRVKSQNMTENEFNIFRESLMRRYSNTSSNQPIQQAQERFLHNVYDKHVTSLQLSAASKLIGFDELIEFAAHVFDKRLLEIFIGGNISEADARGISAMVKDNFDGDLCEANAILEPKLVPWTQTSPLYDQMNVEARGNAVFWSALVGKKTDELRTGQELLMKMMKESFYSELRTKQQIGYLVSSSPSHVDRQLLLNCTVQSNAFDSRDILSRIELFLEQFLDELHLDNPTQERFGWLNLHSAFWMHVN